MNKNISVANKLIRKSLRAKSTTFRHWATCVLPVALAWAFVPQASALTSYDEGTAVDLHNSPNDPSSLTFDIGHNEVHGTTGRAPAVNGVAGAVDRDFFTFTVPVGYELNSVVVLPGTTSLGRGSLSFIGATAGTTFGNTVPTTAADLLGYHHYSPLEIGTDILDEIGQGPFDAGFVPQGFNPPLLEGTYSFWIQETSVGTANYGFDFVISPVPDAAPGLMTTAGALALTAWAGARRRR